MSRWVIAIICFAGFLLTVPMCAFAQDDAGGSELWRVVSLRDYNTRVVVAGTAMLGMASGIAGTFLLLRKRSLLSDAVSHATLPGIAGAFMILVAMGHEGKSFVLLLLGAAVTGLIGMFAVLAIRNYTRIKDDGALAIVLSGFFALGISLVTMASRLEGGSAAGLETYIYGKTASMLMSDAILIGMVAAAVALICGLLFKEFTLLCFDQEFAASQGWPTGALDILLMGLIVAVTVIGLQAVGLILVVALLIIPPAAARFWSHRLHFNIVIAAAIGGLSGLVGCLISALNTNLPAGAIIVLVAASFFTVSLLFGAERGLVRRVLLQRALMRRIRRQHLLRALYELAEEAKDSAAIPFRALRLERSWSDRILRRAIARARRGGLVVEPEPGVYTLTESGAREAARVVRNHRLWEMYLITHADVAPSHVDRDADQIEHILDQGMIAELERLIEESGEAGALPPSPHRLNFAWGDAS